MCKVVEKDHLSLPLHSLPLLSDKSQASAEVKTLTSCPLKLHILMLFTNSLYSTNSYLTSTSIAGPFARVTICLPLHVFYSWNYDLCHIHTRVYVYVYASHTLLFTWRQRLEYDSLCATNWKSVMHHLKK